MDRRVRNELVVENLPLVGYLVSQMMAKATHLSREDLMSVGAIALVTAADSYDTELGVPFGAYARRRVLGAFADDMRSADWASRGTRKRIKESQGAQAALTAALGRTPTVDELAHAMGIDAKSAADVMTDAARSVVALDDVMTDYLEAESQTPEQNILESEERLVLRAAVEALPERMRYIVQCIFFEGATVKEVAANLGVTHSAVSQQRSEAMRLIRAGLEAHYSDAGVSPNTILGSAAEVAAEAEAAALAKGPLKKSPAKGGQRREQYLQDFADRSHGGYLRREPVLVEAG